MSWLSPTVFDIAITLPPSIHMKPVTDEILATLLECDGDKKRELRLKLSQKAFLRAVLSFIKSKKTSERMPTNTAQMFATLSPPMKISIKKSLANCPDERRFAFLQLLYTTGCNEETKEYWCNFLRQQAIHNSVQSLLLLNSQLPTELYAIILSFLPWHDRKNDENVMWQIFDRYLPYYDHRFKQKRIK